MIGQSVKFVLTMKEPLIGFNGRAVIDRFILCLAHHLKTLFSMANFFSKYLLALLMNHPWLVNALFCIINHPELLGYGVESRCRCQRCRKRASKDEADEIRASQEQFASGTRSWSRKSTGCWGQRSDRSRGRWRAAAAPRCRGRKSGRGWTWSSAGSRKSGRPDGRRWKRATSISVAGRARPVAAVERCPGRRR